jgi:hypothetical protein
MNTIIEVVGFWYADEIADLIESQIGIRPGVSTAEDRVILHGLELQPAQKAAVAQYFAAHPQATAVQRQAQEEASAQTLRDAVKAVAETTAGVAINDLTAQQVKALVAILLWQAGAIDAELKVRPLGEWV